jgi:hypothetical protein
MIFKLNEIGPANLYWSLIGVVVSFLVGRAILKWQKRRDKLHFLEQRWHQQQLLNMHQLLNMPGLEAFEKIVYGPTHQFDPDTARKYHLLFLFINMIQSHYFAMNHGIITRREFEAYAKPTLKLIVREHPTITYLLSERGYPFEFKNEVERLLKILIPPAPQEAVP